MEILYDQPFEVTAKQYTMLMARFQQVVAGRTEGGKYFIKVWVMSYVPQIKRALGAC